MCTATVYIYGRYYEKCLHKESLFILGEGGREDVEGDCFQISPVSCKYLNFNNSKKVFHKVPDSVFGW